MIRPADLSVLKVWQKPESLSQARAVARLGGGALAVGAVANTIRYSLSMPSPADVMELMRTLRGPVTLEQAGVDQVMFEQVIAITLWLGTATKVIIVAAMLAMALWQWKRPGWVVPLLYLVCVLFGLTGLMSAISDEVLRQTLTNWSNLVGWGVHLVLAVVMLAAYRGGRLYQQFQDQQK